MPIDKFYRNKRIARMMDVDVIEDAATAASILDPLRSAIMHAAAEPGSASTLAAQLGESRQKVNYHLHALEAHGLVHLVHERPRRGLTERIVVASARSYVVSPEARARTLATPDTPTDSRLATSLPSQLAWSERSPTSLGEQTGRARRWRPCRSIPRSVSRSLPIAVFTDELTAAMTALQPPPRRQPGRRLGPAHR